MKRFSLAYLFLLCVFGGFSNAYDFSGLQGLRSKKGDIYFEISGYDIRVTFEKGNITNKKAMTSLKRKFEIRDIQAEYSESQLDIPNQIIEAQSALEKNPTFKINDIFYFIQTNPNEITLIAFSTLNQRDIFMEQAFVKTFFSDSLNGYISDDWNAKSISFAGQTVSLGNACTWRTPHNLYCKGAQISWSEFPSFEAVDVNLDLQIAANNNDNFVILSEESIDVLFEDIPTVAYRVAYRLKNSEDVLIVYYIGQEVRGRYISCVMSHFGVNRNDFRLPPLIKQLMTIPVLPDWAVNELDTPQYEIFTKSEDSNYVSELGEFRVGAIVPLGNLSRIFTFAPSANLFFAIPIRQKMSLDLGFGMAVPVNPSRFDFHYMDEIYKTRASMLAGVSLRCRYNHLLSEKWYCSSYFGCGASSLTTDLVKEVNDDGSKEYHDITTLDLYGGIRLSYRRWGCFVEYHQTLFSNSTKVANHFGNSFLNVGFTYSYNFW